MNESTLVIASCESFMNKMIETFAFCFLACFSTKLIRICPSFFHLQLSKKDFLVVATKSQSFSKNPEIVHNYFC